MKMFKTPLISTSIIFLITAVAFAQPQGGKIMGWGERNFGANMLGEYQTISAGSYHALGLRKDGSIAAWGYNKDEDGYYLGQCDVPAPNSDFIAVAGGPYHSLAIKSDNSVVGWGDNSFDQCDVPLPNTDFIAVSAGLWHSIGLKSDNTIAAWGSSGSGAITTWFMSVWVSRRCGEMYRTGTGCINQRMRERRGSM